MLSLVWERRPFKGKKPVGDGGSVPQAEEERDDMERVKLDNKRILFNLLPAHVAQHFLMSNPRNMVSTCSRLPPHRAAAPRTDGGHRPVAGAPTQRDVPPTSLLKIAKHGCC